MDDEPCPLEIQNGHLGIFELCWWGTDLGMKFKKYQVYCTRKHYISF